MRSGSLLRVAMLAALTLLQTIAWDAAVRAQPATDAAATEQEMLRLYQAGRYADAIGVAKRLLALREKALGPDHADVGTSVHVLAELHRIQGLPLEAETLYKRALAIREKALGPEHPLVGASVNNIALLYAAQGRYGEAEPLYKRALAIGERAHGQYHQDVARYTNNLAELYRAAGRRADAEPLYRRSISITERLVGPEHIDVATTLNNLALLFASQGRYAEAEPLYKRATAIFEKALGPDHPEVATVVNNTAELSRMQGRLPDGERLNKRALAIREKSLGRDHPDVAVSLNNLALIYWAQGRFAEASPLYTRTVAIFEKVYGPSHPDVATALSNLAELHRAQGQLAEAEPLNKRVLAIREKLLGPEHPDVATTLNNIGLLQMMQGHLPQAEQTYLRALAIFEKVVGVNHPDTANALMNLAELYRLQERPAESEALKKRIALIPKWEVADIPVYFATNRIATGTKLAPAFGNDQEVETSRISVGRAIVRAPKSEVLNRAGRTANALGQLDRATGRQTNELSLSLHRIELADGDSKRLFADARSSLSRAARFPKQGFIYVHGYNNSFEEAVRRTAMIAYDLDFDGTAFVFAWPARRAVLAYMGDRDRSQIAAAFLLEMLETIGAALPDVKLHLIAHSTGAEVLLNALERLSDRTGGKTNLKLGEVILAHADVNRVRFGQVMESVRKLGLRVTSYSSTQDWAMWASDQIRREGGRVGGAPVYLAGVDSIDVSRLSGRFSLNHNIFVHNPMVFGDMARLMSSSERPPEKRTRYFSPVKSSKGTFWEFRPITDGVVAEKAAGPAAKTTGSTVKK